MSNIREHNRPIHIYKENGFRKSNDEKFVKDDTISIVKNTLGQVFRIAIKGTPSIVYYFDEVEKRLNGKGNKDSLNIVDPTITDTIGRQELNEEIDSLSKQLNAKGQEINQLEERLEKQKKKIEKLEKQNIEGSLEHWKASKYTRFLGLLTFLLLVLSIILLFMRLTKDKSKLDQLHRKQGTGSKQGQKQGTGSKQGQKQGTGSKQGQKQGTGSKQGQKQGTGSKQGQRQGTGSKQGQKQGTGSKQGQKQGTGSKQGQKQGAEFEKLLEKQKGEINQLAKEFNEQVKSIEDNLNAGINEKIIPLQENQIKILEILKQLNNEQISPVIEKEDDSAMDENDDNSNFASLSDSSYPITSNENKSFYPIVKSILDVLNQAVSNIRKEADVKRGGNKVVNNIIQRFDQRDKLLKEEGRRWLNIFKQIKEGYIKDEKIIGEINNENNPLKEEEILFKWFFKDYLCDYISNILILLEEYRNKASFANNKAVASNDKATINTIKKITKMMEQNMDIKIHYTPLFHEPNIIPKFREEWDNDQLSNNYQKIYSKIKKKSVAEIKQFGMSGKYQTNPSKEKTRIIVKE